MSFKIAIVGRPNVGKSSLFNRIIGKRHAITHQKAGITRDRIYATAEWLTKTFGVIDTGGIEIQSTPFLEQIKLQAQLAVDEADVIVFVVDGQTGLTQNDIYLAKLLYKTKKPVLLAVNKIDNHNLLSNTYEFYALGFDTPFAISTQHGIGIGDLLDKIVFLMRDAALISDSSFLEDLPIDTPLQSPPSEFNYEIPEKQLLEPEQNQNQEKDNNIIKFCVVGRPNVGKSTLTNSLLASQRMIVSDMAGTTTDAVDTFFENDGQKYQIIDTAGIKKRGKIYEQEDKYSVLRALGALEKADIACLVLDAKEGILEQDKNIAGFILEHHKACIIIVNKWDLLEKYTNTLKNFEQKIRQEFVFLSYAPVIFLSALKKSRLTQIFAILKQVFNNYKSQFSTSLLNDILQEATLITPPTFFNQKKAKFQYIFQTKTKAPEFLCFVNDPKHIHFSYERFLKNQFRKSLDLEGTPLKIIFHKKKSNF
ncbi:ribosome biogenesis GTPase Der ['Santalum album' aster yellows phytoplasma]|uniref:GTPase Der n=1 Tax='Santalum album' aster yellows phytoplasma TaxID=2831467 RepID=A0ABS5LLA9_9MOLU|nr:ribosome biogenesis GTPase Der ['Santalum album' aster yellows phytoplasma]MBS2993761.1 ribosome biogenesis GTPase Der ['Santalum album' aster yellows phytoplasma]